jgi:ATP-dependent Lhr-like helicase
VTPENVEELLRERLESSGFFGAKFRENAARALLLPRAGFHRRFPLWLNRLRAKRLHETVMRFPDFPIVLETWRECLQDAFDLPNLKMVLDELQTGRTEFTEVENEVPSPFCGGLVWRQTNKYMYEDDTPEGRAPAGLSRKLLDEVLYSSQLRPRIARRLAEELEGRLQRLKAGYAPATGGADWLKSGFLSVDEGGYLSHAGLCTLTGFRRTSREVVRHPRGDRLHLRPGLPMLARLFPSTGRIDPINSRIETSVDGKWTGS